jgi:ATP-binding cassette subfamily B protein
MDRSGAFLTAFLPRGWLVVSIAAIAPVFLSAQSSSSSDMAVALGGILLAFRAWQRLSASLWQIVGAGVAWTQVAPLFRAAGNAEPASAPAVENPRTSETEGQTVVETCDLVFRYRERGEPVLRHINLKIREGDRLLLEGPSGGGKSTLGSVLTGLRTAESGLLLAGGLDRQTLGAEGWRKRVSAAPQFHENYVLTGTFAFNLLMGRRWPPHPGDMEDAAAICRQLGLDELLARMPAGLFQMVGESGWQLSHGERSRLYIARALLQGSEMVVLDESFAALDPENLRRSLDCVLERAPTLLVIAHP